MCVQRNGADSRLALGRALHATANHTVCALSRMAIQGNSEQFRAIHSNSLLEQIRLKMK